MVRDYHRRAEKTLSLHADEAAEQFDATILCNRVHETVDGQHNRDHHLLRALDLAERAYDLSDDAEADQLDTAAFGAAEELMAVTDDLVEQQIATACVEVIQNVDDWTDVWDQEQIDAAKHEAREWIQTHRDAADRADLLDEVDDDS